MLTFGILFKIFLNTLGRSPSRSRLARASSLRIFSRRICSSRRLSFSLYALSSARRLSSLRSLRKRSSSLYRLSSLTLRSRSRRFCCSYSIRLRASSALYFLFSRSTRLLYSRSSLRALLRLISCSNLNFISSLCLSRRSSILFICNSISRSRLSLPDCLDFLRASTNDLNCALYFFSNSLSSFLFLSTARLLASSSSFLTCKLNLNSLISLSNNCFQPISRISLKIKVLVVASSDISVGLNVTNSFVFEIFTLMVFSSSI